ncbi:MAG: Calx-beta domain-containing protein, partial [Panacagrimonas sp.]
RTFYNDLGLTAGQSYSYVIQATNASGTTNSNTISVSIPANICQSTASAPKITNVSPGAVKASINVQTLKVSGENFSADANIVLHNFMTGQRLPNRMPTSLTSREFTLGHLFSTEDVGPWGVEIKNPDGQESGIHRFEVVLKDRPDLVIDAGSLTVTPAAVTAGQSIQVQARIRNRGAVASPPSQIRFRLSADAVASKSQDAGLIPLDTAIPAIAAGSTHTLDPTTLTVPGNTTSGSYYIVAFVDPLDSADQSDITNDDGVSTSTITVDGTGASPPFIISFGCVPDGPCDTPLEQGQTKTLRVSASGQGLQYQWFRNGLEILQVSPEQSELVVGAGGRYSVKVSNNGGGSIRTVGLDVSSNVAPTLINELGNRSHLTSYGPTFDSERPTVVITHGWQPNETYNPLLDRSWQKDIATSILNRLGQVGKTANIFTFSWSGAFTDAPLPTFYTASGFTASAAKSLVNDLKEKWPNGNSNGLHLIGHSLGTIVNAIAVQELASTFQNIQVTILDAPIKIESITAYSPESFHQRLAAFPIVTWVDNYYGNSGSSDNGDYPAQGTVVAGTAPSGGLLYDGAQHGEVHKRYLRTINKVPECNAVSIGSCSGFDWSIALGIFDTSTRPVPRQWRQLSVDAAEAAQDALEAEEYIVITGDGRPATFEADGVRAKGLCMQANPILSPDLRCGFDHASPAVEKRYLKRRRAARQAGVVKTSEATPDGLAIAMVDIAVPADADRMKLILGFAKVADNTRVSVLFNETPLHVLYASTTEVGDFDTAEIPVAQFAGQAGELKFVLESDDSGNSAVLLSDIRFYQQATLGDPVQPDPDLPDVSIEDVFESELNSGTRNFAFTVRLSEPASGPVSVSYATVDVDALAGSDYTARSGTVNFVAGDVEETVSIAVRGDTAVETDEAFFVYLSDPVGATLSSDEPGIGIIMNDDVATTPEISINNVSVTEGASGKTKAAKFTVTLNRASTQTVTVNFATANATAVAPGDYTAKSGSLSFAPGTTSKPVSVTVKGDSTRESSETFQVNLSGPVNATIGDGQGIGTITNDD